MALSFQSATPTWNVDIQGSTKWTATGNAGQRITWTASPPDIVSLTPQGTNNVECVIQARKLGQAMITITAPNVASTSRVILVGGLLAYGPDGRLYGTYATDWKEVEVAQGIPTAEGMSSAGYGFAFVPPTQWTDTSFNVTCYLISLQTMTNLVPPTTTTSMASVNQAAVDYRGSTTPQELAPPNVREVTVAATEKLVDTGVDVAAGDHVTVEALSGSWTANPATGMVGAAGNSRYTAKPGYLLPGRPEGCLCGQVGQNSTFYVGPSAQVPAGQTGRLKLGINDDVTPQYGSGYVDNRGSLTVRITKGAGG